MVSMKTFPSDATYRYWRPNKEKRKFKKIQLIKNEFMPVYSLSPILLYAH
jgi:hypothetical protein